MSRMPEPTTVRWQPLRTGLKNIYRYDDEQFLFSGGRLLLRGNNGTGKTRILALTLPFLLDGETRPARVEPDGNANRRIEWHLLMDRWHERTGYAWIEFGRLEDGQQKYCTLGCGMRAIEGHQGLRARWYFVSSRRIGNGLTLSNEQGEPLPKDVLKESLEGHGTLYESAEAYREAVDGALFKIGKRRYEALIKLLIELRRPQLSRELNEEVLSTALSDALSPIEQSILDDVAEGYSGLERDRHELEAIQTAAEAVATYNTTHRREISVHAGRLADAVRTAHARYDEAQGAVRAAEEASQKASVQLGNAQGRFKTAESDRDQHAGVIEALQASPAMRTAERLTRIHRDAEQAAGRAAEDARLAEESGREVQKMMGEVNELQKRAETAGRELAGALKKAKTAAVGVGVSEPTVESPAEQHGWLEQQGRAKRQAAVELARHDTVVQNAENESTHAARRVRDEEQRREAALRLSAEADDRLSEAIRKFRTAASVYLSALVECRVDLAAVSNAVEDWLNTPEERDPITSAVNDAASVRLQDLATQRASMLQEKERLERSKALLQEEERRLRAGVDPGPPPMVWRDYTKRQTRPGAPLWKLVDFRSEVTDRARANVEAALQASGLLDAWLHPQGRLEIENEGEAYFLAGDVLDEGSLGSVLTPSIDASDPQASAVSIEDVQRVLHVIGTRPEHGACWVTDDGRWRNGPVHGSWVKPVAEHLGAGARAAARRTRLEAIAREVESIDRDIKRAEDALGDYAAAGQRVTDEQDGIPDLEVVRQPWRQAQGCKREVATISDQVAKRQTEAARLATALQQTLDERKQFALDCGLTEWIGRTGDLKEALVELELKLRDLHHAVRAEADCSSQVERASHRVPDARAKKVAADGRAEQSQNEASRLDAELRELKATAGAASEEILRRMKDARTREQRIQEEIKAAGDAITTASQEVGRAAGVEQEATKRLQDLTAERTQHMSRLREVASTGYLAILGESFSTALPSDAADTRILDLARALAKTIGNTPRDDAVVDRLQTQISEAFQELHRALSSSNLLPVGDVRYGIHVVHVPFQGRDRGTVELGVMLKEDAAQRQTLLTASERKVIENFLLDEAASHLHGLLHEAEKWVATVNRELEERPMSTGMALRFRWQPDEHAPEGIDAARDRLLRPSHSWSPDDREGLAAFLQRRIETAREEQPGATWQEQLGYALDYRRWHRFIIDRRDHAGKWVRLTKRTHGTGSGGEKAVALTMPQFAAAAAHYHGSPHAPRLILLDEAFVGIDNDMRRNCLGLLASFDLDVVMTSEREWGCYDTVPALAIYQLASEPGGDCIATTRYVWDGRKRIQDDLQS